MKHTLDSINSKVEKRIIKHGSKGGPLDLYNMKLKEVPSSIGNLTNLKELCLHNNRLTEIPQSITRLTNLTRLSLVYGKGNEDLIYPPYSLIEPYSEDSKKQKEVILEYCRTHGPPIKTRYNELWNCIKLMYIGHYKENIHCKDTFGNIPIEVIGVINYYVFNLMDVILLHFQ